MQYLHKSITISLICQYGLFIHTCASKYTIMSNDTLFCFFDIRWYAGAATYTKHLFFSHSIVPFIFSEQQRGGDRVKLTKCDTGGMERNKKCIQLFEWSHRWFVALLSYFERKWVLNGNLAINYPWSTNCLENFSVLMLLMEPLKFWKIDEFPEISAKRKNLKTFYEPQTASRVKKSIQHPTRLKVLTSLQQIFSYGDLQEYTGTCFPSALRNQFLGF